MTSNILSSSFFLLCSHKRNEQKKNILRKCFILCRTQKNIYICYMHTAIFFFVFFSSTVQSNNYYCHSVKCFFLFLISPLFWFRQTITWCCVCYALCDIITYYYIFLYVYTDCFFLKKLFSLNTAFFLFCLHNTRRWTSSRSRVLLKNNNTRKKIGW